MEELLKRYISEVNEHENVELTPKEVERLHDFVIWLEHQNS
jgi:hypothetical protein